MKNANIIMLASLVMTCVISKPAVPMTPVQSAISDSGKIKLSKTIEEVIATQFSSLAKLPSKVGELDLEFDQWKAILPSATGVGLLIIMILLLVFRNSLERKMLELKIRVRNLEKRKMGTG